MDADLFRNPTVREGAYSLQIHFDLCTLPHGRFLIRAIRVHRGKSPLFWRRGFGKRILINGYIAFDLTERARPTTERINARVPNRKRHLDPVNITIVVKVDLLGNWQQRSVADGHLSHQQSRRGIEVIKLGLRVIALCNHKSFVFTNLLHAAKIHARYLFYFHYGKGVFPATPDIDSFSGGERSRIGSVQYPALFAAHALTNHGLRRGYDKQKTVRRRTR